MKLSEAILLGSSMLKPVAGRLGEGDEGCALGMAGVAACGKHDGVNCDVFTWVNDKSADSPCGCFAGNFGMKSVRAWIAHIFNEHVMDDKTWTLEQLCDWIRTVEPAETFVGVSELIDITDSVIKQNGFAVTEQVSCGSVEGHAGIDRIMPLHGSDILGVRESYPANSDLAVGKFTIPPTGIKYAVTECEHGVRCNKRCPECDCDHEEYLEAEAAMAAAEQDAMARGYQGR